MVGETGAVTPVGLRFLRPEERVVVFYWLQTRGGTVGEFCAKGHSVYPWERESRRQAKGRRYSISRAPQPGVSLVEARTGHQAEMFPKTSARPGGISS